MYSDYKHKSKQKSSQKIVKQKLEHYQLGLSGEKYIVDKISASGYIARFAGCERFSGDCLAINQYTGEILKIEVKTAQCGAKGEYRFCLIKENHTSHKHSDFVVLVCVDNNGTHYTYVIPSSLIFSTYITISSHPTRYRGKYSPFKIYDNINFDETRLVAELW